MEQHGYTVIRALGQGGCQSRVYEVRDTEGRLRVLKQLPWIRQEDREQAMCEVRLLSSLRHPCIVPYLESFLVRSTPSMPSEDVLCLVMHRCERDLRQECLRRRLEWELDRDEEHATAGTAGSHKVCSAPCGARFEETQVLCWLVQLCWGLQHLHARKFLHRDLKSQNVLLTHAGRRALLADFGVAGKVDHTEDLRRSIVGTPAFMSPEMLEGRPYGLKTDQWALGCVLFEMMALEPPFANCGESYAAVVGAVLHAAPMSPPPGYSHALGEILQALLARKPHERPSNRELLRGGLLRRPFHAFVQSLEQAAAAATAHADRLANASAPGTGAPVAPHFQRAHSSSHGLSSTTVSTVPTALPTGVHTLAPPTARESPFPSCRGGTTPILTPSELGSPPRRINSKNVGICGLPAFETEVASYASDFESMSESPLHSAHAANIGPASPAAVLLGSTGGDELAGCSLSVRSDLSGSSEPPEASTGALGGVGLATGEWRQLLAEAEALLQPPLEESKALQEESRRLRGRLCTTLGGPLQVDKALGFLRERRPLGDTAEADELLLQVELLDILGDDGLHALPHLERLLTLESMVGKTFSAELADTQQSFAENSVAASGLYGIEKQNGTQLGSATVAAEYVPNHLEPLAAPMEGCGLAGTGSLEFDDVVAAFVPGDSPARLEPAPLGSLPLLHLDARPELLN